MKWLRNIQAGSPATGAKIQDRLGVTLRGGFAM
jgi:hypothetical protein